MKKIWLGILLLILVGAAVLGWRLAHKEAAAPEAEGKEGETAKESVVHVEAAKIERKTISEKIVTYGSVIAQPGKIHALPVAFETRVLHVLVAPGQFVRKDDPLVSIEPSPAAQLQFQQAKNTAEAAQKELRQVQERFNLKLATNQDLGTAQKAAQDAALQFASLEKQETAMNGMVRADMEGLVSKVDAQDGQIVAAGSPIIEIVAEDEIEVKLGVEAEDLALLRAGQPVAFFPIDDANAGKVEGVVRIVTRRVDPATRLVDVYVSLPAGTKLLLDGYVRAEITRSSENALVVPRAAVLPEEEGYSVVTVEGNRATKHAIKTGLENERETEVIAPDLREGQTVVVAGNYELESGMTVEVGKLK